MIKGKMLKQNSTIGIVCPASCSPKENIESYVKEFENLGFNVVLGNHVYDKNGYLAGSDKDRAKDLMDMFKDDSIDGIICFRGGYGSIRILPYLDMKVIKKHPKFFCGYSDITILLNYFASNKFISFHGPMIKSKFNDLYTLPSLKKFMMNPTKGYIYDLSSYRKYNNNHFSGRLMGGNLSMLCSCIGTPFEVNFDNSILMIEEIDESPYVIDRLLTQLILSSKLNKCNGILIGHITDCDNKVSSPDENFTAKEIIEKRLLPLNIPIIYGLPFGHSYPNLTFPIGCSATYEKNTSKLVICENPLK
ncbi:MAG: LD-carboxypeptidase [Clostridium sp.]|uniref:S66 peptidase family protein n=1 Tax=Clostridium sp. TaxID=1506 RepID=UPI002FC6AAB6